MICHDFTQFYSRKQKLEVTLVGQQLSVLRFDGNVRISNSFCGHNVLTESVFATELSGDAGKSV